MIIVGSARSDENGNLKGGKVGDQNGKEVSMQTFYVHKKGWKILRPISVEHANKIAKNMKTACDNNKIGYDQSNRLGVVKHGINTKVATEADCSALARECVQEATGVEIPNFTTATQVKTLEATGLFYDAVPFVSQGKTPVYNGDVLVTKTKGHTVIVVSGNPRPIENVGCYKQYKGTSTKLNTVLKAVGVPDKYIGTWAKRKPIAKANGITNYTGTATQNLKLISLAKKGELKKVV